MTNKKDCANAAQIKTLTEELKELSEILKKAQASEIEYLKLKAENRKRRQAEGLPW